MPEPIYPLAGVRVVELGEELSEFAGKMLAGAGADVVKIEPPPGERTRRNGPFLADQPGPDRSLYFWHYNQAKRGITLDIQSGDGHAALAALIAEADVVLTGYDPPTLDRLNLFPAAFAGNPRRIWTAITPFGLEGPYRNLAHSDLIQLAMGGQMMVCGYDPMDWTLPQPVWDTPPIAPQMWHSYQVAGNFAYMAILAALIDRESSGRGQEIEIPTHVALDECTELAQPMYLVSKEIVHRQTSRHATANPSAANLRLAGDGRFLHGSVMLSREGEIERVHRLLESAGVEIDPHKPLEQTLDEYVATQTAEDAFHAVQRAGIHWAPIRAAEDNLADPHFRAREVFADVPHPELGRSFTYLGRPWRSDVTAWRSRPRAPLLGEHTWEVLGGRLGYSRAQYLALAESGIV